MSTKPAILPQWATNALATVEPPLLKKQSGFVGAERPPAKHLNWLINNLYLWAEYLRDGALQGAHSVSGLLTASAGVQVAAGQNLTLLTGSRIKHGNFAKRLPITQFTGGLSFALIGGIGLGATGVVNTFCEIPLMNTKRLKRMFLGLTDAVGSTWRLDLYKNSTLFASSLVSSGAGSAQSLIINSLSEVMLPSNGLTAYVSRQSGAGTASIYSFEIEYDEA